MPTLAQIQSSSTGSRAPVIHLEATTCTTIGHEHWSPDSWQSKPISQEIEYADQGALDSVCAQLRTMRPLIAPARIEALRRKLAEVANGRAFVMQGGDCAESFDDVRGDIIAGKRALLSQQSQALQLALGKPVVEIGRMAGQFAKPRSAAFEVLADGRQVPPFKGDNINSRDTTARMPDPRRLLVGHHLAATTLAFLELLDGQSSGQTMHTSHEALNLHLESAVTHGHYNTAADFLWIGERTRRLDGAHVEYCRGLRNPVGVKLGPGTDAGELVRLLAILDPTTSPGRVTLITRLGAVQVERVLPRLIAAVKASGHVPVWMCDPCHGNTFSTADGVKTRMVESVAAEVRKTFEVHARCGSHLGGLHLEQTGEEVTECVERAQALNDAVSFPHYRSLCDPRLSPGQAMKVVQALTAAAARGADDEIAILPATAHAVGEQAAEVRMVVEQSVL
ncbi:putative phospho-2-dehydro-3-deoxyheptonate aldolase [Lasiodiplodia hormozganensis]|uniref:Phospho-2-dehydro-3-deoxyheptonate aldolase n=1 Tax=Lasiodiplodia hormozganensis TaxID=869390 RepID=A0AA39YKC4_9PEZI|nr:putative phospho-2-dehydro-3-deoxyheptonate aldolase [Lasiodiplodia hormozganensis]